MRSWTPTATATVTASNHGDMQNRNYVTEKSWAALRELATRAGTLGRRAARAREHLFGILQYRDQLSESQQSLIDTIFATPSTQSLGGPSATRVANAIFSFHASLATNRRA